MKTENNQEAQFKVLVFIYDGCDSLFLFSVIKHVRFKSVKFTRVELMAHWSLIHIEPLSVTLDRSVVSEVGWGNWLPGLGVSGNCPAVTLQPLPEKGVVTLTVVEKLEDSQEGKTCIRKKP